MYLVLQYNFFIIFYVKPYNSSGYVLRNAHNISTRLLGVLLLYFKITL